ncbi:MAG: DMT family transporter [Anaerolineae bacterium]
MISTRNSALASGCLAALGWGLTGTFVKLLPSFSTFEVLAYRLIVSLLTILPILIFNRPLRSQFTALIQSRSGLTLSSLMVLYYLFAVRAFQLAPVSDVVLVVGLSPIIGLVVNAFRKKPVTLWESLGALTAFFGLILFVLPKLQGASDQSAYFTGLFFALLSACVSLGYATLFKQFASENNALNPISVAFATFLIGSILILPIAILTSSNWTANLQQTNVGWIILGLGTLSTVVPTLCYSYAAKYLSPILTTALNLLTPIFAAIIAAVLLNERLTFLSAIGAGLIIVGILALSLAQTRSAEQSHQEIKTT